GLSWFLDAERAERGTARETGLAGRPSAATRLLRRRRGLMPLMGGAGSLAAVLIAAVVIVPGDQASEFSVSEPAPSGDSGQAAESQPAEPSADSTEVVPPAGGTVGGDRARTRSAELELVTDPGAVGRIASSASQTVDRRGGIVVTSTLQEGDGAERAELVLRVPEARLSATVSDLSRLATVRSRRQGSTDITDQIAGTRRGLEQARRELTAARRQLRDATTDAQRRRARDRVTEARTREASLERQLRDERRGSENATITVTVTDGEDEGSSAASPWGFGDAVADAKRILLVTAGVGVVVAAVLVPFALLGLGGLAAWQLRGRRHRAARELALDRS
ncbi:MAG: DUF4349 domain-containing protein, partial [Solirubrobacterales bacterium]